MAPIGRILLLLMRLLVAMTLLSRPLGRLLSQVRPSRLLLGRQIVLAVITASIVVADSRRGDQLLASSVRLVAGSRQVAIGGAYLRLLRRLSVARRRSCRICLTLL